MTLTFFPLGGTETDKTDAFLDSAMSKVEASYAKCEADKIDASGGAYTMTSDNAAVTCPAGSKCLRIWLKINADVPGAPQYQETGCP